MFTLLFLRCLEMYLFAGDTFTDGSVRYTMTSMNVPEPVMSLAIAPASKDVGPQVYECYQVLRNMPAAS